MVWKLAALTAEHATKVVTLGAETLIGRHQDCDVVLQSAQVSRRHAALVIQDHALVLQDLNSSNGTYVNGERVMTQQLQAGDVIRIDQLEFKVVFEAEAALTQDVTTLATEAQESVQDVPTLQAETVQVERVEAASVQEEKHQQETLQDEKAQDTPAPEESVHASAPAYVAPVSAHDEGMPSLAERAKDVDVSPQGMPSRVQTPKPAPIPEGVDVSKVIPEPDPIPVEAPISRVEQEKEQQKNASVGLISVIALIIFAILAWVLFK